MRKKSHISLAQYILHNMNKEELYKHKKALYVGSILPDCMPSFVTRKHCINDTFEILRNEIIKVTDRYHWNKKIGSYYCRHLGVITHYIADYFTLPHNDIFTGTLKEHCSYENELKHRFREYVHSEEARKKRETFQKFKSVDEICDYIKQMHEEYLLSKQQISIDCEYIVELCHKVVDSILQIFELIDVGIKGKMIVAFA